MQLVYQVLEMQKHGDANVIYDGYERRVAEAVYQEAMSQGREVYISAYDEGNTLG